MKVLHVGCGGSTLPDIFPDLEEIRLDLDPASGANMIGSMLDIPLDDGRVDVVYTSHTLEHVTQHDGVRALKEFLRVLRKGGQCICIVPNIGALAERIASGGLRPARFLPYTLAAPAPDRRKRLVLCSGDRARAIAGRIRWWRRSIRRWG